jgi:predicted RNase H-like HicB family nuclease
MLIDYIQAAMRRAKYEMLEGNEGFVGRVPGFKGVVGHARTLEACRDDLDGALQAWLLVKLRQGDGDLPVLNGMDLTSTKSPGKARQKHPSPRAA